MNGSYDLTLVTLSFLVAVFVSYTALNLASRVFAAQRRVAIWLSGGAVAMGVGIWSMHFVGMLAFSLPIAITYDISRTLVSLLVAIAVSAFALVIANRPNLSRPRMGRSALTMGLGISAMHYTAMFASQFASESYCLGGAQPSSHWLAITIAGFALGILAVTMILIFYDDHLETEARQHAAALEDANAKLDHQATHDALTGLPNRVLLEDRLRHAIALAQRSGTRFALLVMDLDRFKLINDSLGHHAGDELLKEVAGRLRQILRRSDTLARLGGDEFVMIIDEISERGAAQAVAQKILATIGQRFRVQSLDVHTSSSIGISVYPDDTGELDTLLANADTAMYRAKQIGGNTFQFFTIEMNMHAQQRLVLESGLRRALAEGELELHYQPKVDVLSGQINSAEALVRWRDPSRGLVSPGEFIPLAEEVGLILQIGDWVLREACRQTRRWQLEGLPSVRVAVNVAAQQFRQANFVASVREALEHAELEPYYLELEITESAVMLNAAASALVLEQLSRLGVHISIDDFGTGYSSLAYLRSFPLDKLKIDRSFIGSIPDNAENAAIVNAIVSLSHSLDLHVIAEGVETQLQLDYLRKVGCDQYQGYLFSAALPADAFAKLIRLRQLESTERRFDPVATMSRLYIGARKQLAK